MVVGSNPVAVTSPSDFAPASSKEFLDIQATIECGFTLKRVRDMIKTYSLNFIVRDDKYIVAKLKKINKINRTTFTDDIIPFQRNHYICIPAIDIDSVLKINKRAYP